MKIAKFQLKQIIKEELQKSLEEGLFGAMKGALGFDPYGPEEEEPEPESPDSDHDGESDTEEREKIDLVYDLHPDQVWPPPMTDTGIAYLKTLSKSAYLTTVAAAHPKELRKRGWQEDAIQRAAKSLTDADRIEYIVHARGDIRV